MGRISRRGSGKSTPSGYNNAVEFTLREAGPEDFEHLWAIDQKCFPAGIAYTRRELTIYMRRRGAFTILAEALWANEGAMIAGFVVAESNRRGAGHIITIDVLPEHQRAGLGSQLLRAAEDRLRQSGCLSIQLEAAVNNVAAIAFYKRHEYDVVGSIPRYYPGDLNAFVLQKGLLSKETA
ncbi:MAG TPA: GNAT family N-acetyltransferase [Terriglobales bacterium]